MTLIAASALGALLASLLNIFLYVLLARIIIDYVMMFSRTWRPQGLMLALVDVVFQHAAVAVTEPFEGALEGGGDHRLGRRRLL